jgi:mannose-6-phosphate isomerase-like protein (cupin superfamily)
LKLPEACGQVGTGVLAGLVELAERAIAGLHRLRTAGGMPSPMAILGHLRGTGRGVSFTKLVDELERSHPLELVYPFEGSDRVGGAVWLADEILSTPTKTSVAKLCWDSRALDLPMHVHDHSDRFIIVLRGRGFFHVTDESAESFTGQSVRSIPARARDVFLFSRGTVHTFSTDTEPMILLSCQLPYLSFDDPAQYRLPEFRWMARDHRDSNKPAVACDPAWSVLASASSPSSEKKVPGILTGLNEPSWWAAHVPC